MTADVLAHVTELERRVVEEALDELEWQRWLVAEGRGYSFVARLVRRVLRRTCSHPGQRRRLLARIEGLARRADLIVHDSGQCGAFGSGCCPFRDDLG